MPKYYSYVIPRDFGFAPNPFGEHCTLATCKPDIRASAIIGDWIFGTSSIAGKKTPKLIYAMQVTAKITFNEYYKSPDFHYKKAVMNGSLKKMYGDNIYHQRQNENGEIIWLQDDSHHSLKNGEINPYNLRKDTSTTDSVLISKSFYYFGKEAIDIPPTIIDVFCKTGQGHRYVDEKIALQILSYIQQNFSAGLIGFPTMFQEQFIRYDGQS
jgi:hypothetical protein